MSKKRIFKIFSITAILATVALLLPASLPVSAATVNYTPVDVGPKIREWDSSAGYISSSFAGTGSAKSQSQAAATVGDVKIWMILNDYTGAYQATYFTLKAQSSKTQVWVQNSMAWPAGDTRSTPVVTTSQISYLLNQFDNNILPKESVYFGTADEHEGEDALLPDLAPASWGLTPGYYDDEAGRSVVLVSNIRDDNYYDRNYPSYIAGFYSPTFEAYFDRNIISIDAYDWSNRVGGSVARPYLYEGVFAHEWQHLLHDDYDGDEDTFVNEGCAEMAEIICGYTKALQGHIDQAAAHPENALTVWEDQGGLEVLADYGWAALFQIYLSEQYGSSFTQKLFHNEGNGISGIEDTLKMVGSSRDFADVYHDFSVAALVNSSRAGTKYVIKTFPRFRVNIGTMLKPNKEAFDEDGAPPWGTDYIWAQAKPKDLIKFIFNGVPFSAFPTGWESVDGTLWGGDEDLLDNWAIFSAPAGGTLTFKTKFDIEAYWDFGFVQVSTDGGYTWTSLEDNQGFSTSDYDSNAHPTVIENLPGLTGSTDGAWVNLSYDLPEGGYTVPNGGNSLLVAFRYVTDWGTTEDGWFIDDVKVNGNLVSNGSSVAPFKDLTEIIPFENDYTVTFVGIKGTLGSALAQYKVVKFEGVHITDAGQAAFDKMLLWADSMVMLVTYDAEEGVNFYAEYDYQLLFGHPYYKAPAPVTTTSEP